MLYSLTYCAQHRELTFTNVKLWGWEHMLWGWDGDRDRGVLTGTGGAKVQLLVSTWMGDHLQMGKPRT